MLVECSVERATCQDKPKEKPKIPCSLFILPFCYKGLWEKLWAAAEDEDVIWESGLS